MICYQKTFIISHSLLQELSGDSCFLNIQILIQPLCPYLLVGLRTNLEILGNQLATSPIVQKVSWETQPWVYISRSQKCLGVPGLENHWLEVSHSHREPLSLPFVHSPLGMRRVPIPKPGLCVGSSLGLYPKCHENAHRHAVRTRIEQLPASLFGTVNEGKYKYLGPAGPN